MLQLRGFRKVYDFSFRFDERPKDETKLSPNPEGCLPGVWAAKSQPKLVSAKKEIIGLIWEASPQNPPRLVFASVCFHPCVFMRVWLSKCVSLFYLCILPGEPSQNNRAAVLYSILSLDDIQSHFSCTNQPRRTGGPLHARSSVQHWGSRATRRADLCHLPISLWLPH